MFSLKDSHANLIAGCVTALGVAMFTYSTFVNLFQIDHVLDTRVLPAQELVEQLDEAVADQTRRMLKRQGLSADPTEAAAHMLEAVRRRDEAAMLTDIDRLLSLQPPGSSGPEARDAFVRLGHWGRLQRQIYVAQWLEGIDALPEVAPLYGPAFRWLYLHLDPLLDQMHS